VGRGTADAFQRFGAPWLDADAVASLLNGRHLGGLRFDAESFTPESPGDGKFGGQRIAGVHIVVIDRDEVRSGEVGAAILWAIHKTTPDSLRISATTFDERFGSRAVREAILGGADPAVAMAGPEEVAARFERAVNVYWIYR